MTPNGVDFSFFSFQSVAYIVLATCTVDTCILIWTGIILQEQN